MKLKLYLVAFVLLTVIEDLVIGALAIAEAAYIRELYREVNL